MTIRKPWSTGALRPELKGLAVDVTLPGEGADLYETCQFVEDQLIDQAMAATNGNATAAAYLLNLNRTTLMMKLQKRKRAARAVHQQERR